MEAPKCIDAIEFIGLPSEDDAEFLEFTQPSWHFGSMDCHPSMNVPPEPQAQCRNDRRPAPFVSFGDRGTTASAGLYGSLIRICRPVPVHHLHSGMVALGLADDQQPCYASLRAAQFLKEAQSVTSGFGLRVLNAPHPRSSTKTEFLADRWPVLTYSTNGDCRVTVKLWCQQNVTVQQMKILNPMRASEPPTVGLNVKFCMQDLDCLEKRNNLQLEYHQAPHGYGVVAMEKTVELGENHERICVLVSVFKNGKAQKINFLEENDLILMPPFSGHEVEFTAVFKVMMSTGKPNWKQFMVSKSEITCDLSPTIPTGLESYLSEDSQLQWHFRRNLEHILSVCSVPVDIPVLQGDSSISIIEEDEFQVPMITINAPNEKVEVLHRNKPIKRTEPIALTCGDFGDHHISISGSYFAFMFLLEVYQRLPNGVTARQRIHAVCKGHLEWVRNLRPSDACSSNLTINGRRIHNFKSTSHVQDNPSNMPSHIIKATEFFKIFTDFDDRFFICSWLGKFAVEWFQQLVETRQHLTPTWEHSPGSEIPTFRLGDQVMIWKALKGIEEMIQTVQETQRITPHERLKEFLETMDSHLPLLSVRNPTCYPSLDFTAEDLRRQNLRRFTLKFTVEKSELKRRSLSVTRTARETRFLFHSRDTILYYGLEWGFFSGEETVWNELVNSQLQHDDPTSDQARWHNPLRYGLALEMAKCEHQLERSFTPSEMFTHARQVILTSSSENGLFPGKLDDFSKEPVVYRKDSRDSYFHVTFEVPYILLRAAEKPAPSKWSPEETEMYKDDGSSPSWEERKSSRTSRVHSADRRGRSTSSISIVTSTVPEPGYTTLQAPSQTVPFHRTILKRRMPYGKITDVTNLVELEEEWLYKHPDFLNFTPPTEREKLDAIRDAFRHETQFYMHEVLHDSGFRTMLESTISPSFGPCFATINDVRKNQEHRNIDLKEKSISKECHTWVELWHELRRGRTSMSSKRRLMYLRSVDKILATMCYIASPPSERVSIRQFFDRHSKVHVSYFYDDTSAVLNRWETEVHFRFYHILRLKPDTGFSQSPSLLRQLKAQECETFGKDAYLVDTVFSFRIIGDFFDRYWTCHLANSFAEADQGTDRSSPSFQERRFKTIHWEKRRVLELILMNEILDRACCSTESILHCIEHGPQFNSSLAKQKGEVYFSKDSFEDRKPVELRECFQLLVIMRNNINSLQGLVEQWNYRQKFQGRESPRWTRSNEQKYGDAVKQKVARFEDHVREIKATASRIDFLIVLVTNAQDAIRSNREEENITLFTYLNVFFLPVGLAVAIFSVNGTPERNVIGYMAATAAVALLVTIGVLLCVVSHLIPVRIHDIVRLFRNRTISKKQKRSPGFFERFDLPRPRIGPRGSHTDTPIFDLEGQGKRDTNITSSFEGSVDWSILR